ncbi:MAG: hypothetical protein Kow0092_10240 [Deferrisomatales bacterium]
MQRTPAAGGALGGSRARADSCHAKERGPDCRFREPFVVSCGRALFDLFHAARPHTEAFTNPRALDLLARARSVDPTSLLVLTTSGGQPTEEGVARLAGLRPVL